MRKYRLLEPCTTRLGIHAAGTVGVGYNQANGFINYFPDIGGFAILPVSQVKMVKPDAKDEPAKPEHPLGYAAPRALLPKWAKDVYDESREVPVRVITRVINRPGHEPAPQPQAPPVMRKIVRRVEPKPPRIIRR